MVLKTNSATEAQEELARQDAIRKRAARQAAKRELAPLDVPRVDCTILPAGHDKVSMGIHVGGLGEAHFEEGEPVTLDLPVALKLYKRGYVNFEGARAALDEESARIKADATQALADKLAMQRAMELAGL